VSCDEEPPLGSILHMHRVPPDGGGDTMFSNMYAAFEALSPPLRQMLEGMTAIHDSAKVHRYRAKNADRNDMAFPRSVHPVVRTHPVTGRKALFVNQGFTTRIIQLKPHESDAMLQVVSSLRDAGVHMPVPLAAEFGRVLGQSRHSASRLVRLFPASPLRPASHGPGRQAVL
jgi:alpha-ketoglutarate-dependent taurine dioxygenase